MDKRKNDPASQPDDENPEWTAEDFARARPALEVLGEVFGAQAAEAIRRRPGRPAKPDRKINQTLRLDPDVLAAYRSLGPGWQAQMNRVLREQLQLEKAERATISGASAVAGVKGRKTAGEGDGGQLYVERRAQGGFAVRRPGSERDSADLPTQREAIARATELSPGATPTVERVRHASDGEPGKLREP